MTRCRRHLLRSSRLRADLVPGQLAPDGRALLGLVMSRSLQYHFGPYCGTAHVAPERKPRPVESMAAPVVPERRPFHTRVGRPLGTMEPA